ncbi:MAG: hypothetical protein Ct9H300mP1_00360 [Planctomycetaceae bacterium]|nr:MAG: hypothetical protein Ct9H300mP1_00360 [Planctomycetaceae bacterium]
MRPDGIFDVARFRQAARIYITAQEILVDHASYPTPRLPRTVTCSARWAWGTPTWQPVDVDGDSLRQRAGRGICGAMTALLNGEGYRTSSPIASNIGTFAGYAENSEPMLDVMQMHRDAVEGIDDACPSYLKDAARECWDECLASGRDHGFRNAQATVLARPARLPS